MYDAIVTTVKIGSQPSNVWRYLTEPALMKVWMGEPEVNIEVKTDWVVGGPIIITGFHHVKFENRGVVLKFEPCKIIRYTHMSSISRLKDIPENYSIISHDLEPIDGGTMLTTRVEQFANASIYKHLNLYWTTTPGVIRKIVEGIQS